MVFTPLLTASGLQVATLSNSLALKAASMATELSNPTLVVVTGELLTDPSDLLALRQLLLLNLNQLHLLPLLLVLNQAQLLHLLLAQNLILNQLQFPHLVLLSSPGKVGNLLLMKFMWVLLLESLLEKSRFLHLVIAESLLTTLMQLATRPFAVVLTATLVN
jgi:hypothetical protein